MMEDDKEPVYASKAKPWLKYYEEKYIHQSVPECSAFALVCRNNERHLGDTALEYYGRKFTYADLIVNVKKTAAALQGIAAQDSPESAAMAEAMKKMKESGAGPSLEAMQHMAEAMKHMSREELQAVMRRMKG